MGYVLEPGAMQQLLGQWQQDYIVFAPKRMVGEGTFTDIDVVRYQPVTDIWEVDFGQKSSFSFKEIFLPITQTLFYYTEDQVKEANPERQKGAVIFLRSCDIHAVKRLDEIYLNNGAEDLYYKRLREHTRFVLMGCEHSCETGFCASMGTNQTSDYDLAVNVRDDIFEIDCKWDEMDSVLADLSTKKMTVEPDYVTDNEISVQVPKHLSVDAANLKFWDEYDSRCIACGRCNFVCPTCTCFTMQDIFYTDNGKVGERRRVHASCMVDGYTDVAGGGCYRQKNGQRMRFKVLHKVYDYKERFGYHMCTGCGRCDDVCPEYISYANCINRLGAALEEVRTDD